MVYGIQLFVFYSDSDTNFFESARIRFLFLQAMHFPYTKTATNSTVSLSFGEADQFFGIGCIALSTVESMYWYWRFANFE